HAYDRDTVSRIVQSQALGWSMSRRGMPYLSVKRIHEEAARRGINRSSYGVIRPGVFDRELQRLANDARQGLDTSDLHAPVAGGVAHVNEALKIAKDDAGGYSSTQVAVAIPRAVFDELDHLTSRPRFGSVRVGRIAGAAKGVSSRLILGLSPSWLAFSTA